MNKASIAVACALAACATPAFAVENGNANFPQGTSGTDIAAFPPFPGLYVLQQSNYSEASGLYGPNGKKEANPSFYFHSYVNVDRFLISWPFQLPGHGHAYTEFTAPFVNLHQTVAGFQEHVSGWANIAFSPIIATWRWHDFTPIVGLDIVTAGGQVTKPNEFNSEPLSASSQYWTWAPNAGIRYDTRTGIDLAILSRFEINEKNWVDGYHSGNLNESDFLAMYNITRALKAGMVGNFLVQFTDDREANGETPAGGDRETTLAFGPGASYAAHIGTFHFNVDANIQVDVIAKNTIKATNFWFNIAVPIYAPAPHFPAQHVLPNNEPGPDSGHA